MGNYALCVFTSLLHMDIGRDNYAATTDAWSQHCNDATHKNLQPNATTQQEREWKNHVHTHTAAAQVASMTNTSSYITLGGNVCIFMLYAWSNEICRNKLILLLFCVQHATHSTTVQSRLLAPSSCVTTTPAKVIWDGKKGATSQYNNSYITHKHQAVLHTLAAIARLLAWVVAPRTHRQRRMRACVCACTCKRWEISWSDILERGAAGTHYTQQQATQSTAGSRCRPSVCTLSLVYTTYNTVRTER